MELLSATNPLIYYALILNGLLVASLFVWCGVWSVLHRGCRLWLVLLFGISQLLANIIGLPHMLKGRLPPAWHHRVQVDYGVVLPASTDVLDRELIQRWDEYAKVTPSAIEVIEDKALILALREGDGLLHRVSIPELDQHALLLPMHAAAVLIPEGSVSVGEEVTLRCPGGLLHDAHEVPIRGVSENGCESGWATCCLPSAGAKYWLSQNACLGCHSLDGSKLVGPSFKGLWGSERRLSDGSTVIADEDYIRESIWIPGARIVEGYAPQMPSYQGMLDEEKADDIIEFLKEVR